jgi:carbamoyl-phosphate synthase large subunit
VRCRFLISLGQASLRLELTLPRPFSGQLPQNIALRLKQTGVKVLGTDPDMIDNAEDRHKFSSILDSIGVDQPDWVEVTSLDAAKEFANKVT